MSSMILLSSYGSELAECQGSSNHRRAEKFNLPIVCLSAVGVRQ